MTGPTTLSRPARLALAGFAAVLVLVTLTAAPPAAQAFWLGFGMPYPGFYYAPGPYWDYPPPYAYPPPYYPPPAAYYPPAAAPAPGAAAPQAAAPTPQAAAPQTATTAATPQITYTNKPAFTNSAGQTCREYKATDATAGRDILGTACRQPDGQWRVTN